MRQTIHYGVSTNIKFHRELNKLIFCLSSTINTHSIANPRIEMDANAM